jgi:hypothetical protein
MINLYWVFSNADWGFYVFTTSRNRAKTLCLHYFRSDDQYTDYRVHTFKKNVGGESDVVVASPDDKGYDRVLMLGYRYRDEGEVEGE